MSTATGSGEPEEAPVSPEQAAELKALQAKNFRNMARIEQAGAQIDQANLVLEYVTALSEMVLTSQGQHEMAMEAERRIDNFLQEAHKQLSMARLQVPGIQGPPGFRAN